MTALQSQFAKHGRRGLRLLDALATPHGVDRYLELIDPMLTVRALRAQVTAVHRTMSNSITLTLRPTKNWGGFEAGQFIRVSVEIDGVLRSRCYSPASSAHRMAEDTIEITVKKHSDGLVSDYLWRHAEPGLVVDISEADGTFRLPSPLPERILLISAGSGITPVLSMLRTLCAGGFDGEIGFLHYAPRAAEVPAKAEIDALAATHRNVTVRYGFTREPEAGEFDGYFDAEHLDAVTTDIADAQTYLCGPATLMERIRGHFEEAGIAARLHTEDFTPPVITVDAAEATGSVSFTDSDMTWDNSGTPLLEQAEAAGLTPAHGCRMGICFSCTKIKSSGCVRNALTGEKSTEENEEIQLCVSVPVGDVAIDA